MTNTSARPRQQQTNTQKNASEGILVELIWQEAAVVQSGPRATREPDGQ